jgi:uncharacterized protein involved in cysteine biosynthesis
VNQPDTKQPPSAPKGGFSRGFQAPFVGLTTWFSNGELLKTGLPSLGVGLALTAVVALGWFAGSSAIHSWFVERASRPNSALTISLWAISPSLLLGGISMGVLLLTVLGNTLAAPWQWRLAEAAEAQLGPDPSREKGSEPATASEAMLSELKRLAWLLVWLLLGLPLALIPFMGSLLYGVWLLAVMITFLAYLFVGPTLRARGLTRWSKIGFVWRHKASMLGFGLGLSLLALIPLLQASCLPAAAVGAVGLVRELRGKE